MTSSEWVESDRYVRKVSNSKEILTKKGDGKRAWILLGRSTDQQSRGSRMTFSYQAHVVMCKQVCNGNAMDTSLHVAEKQTIAIVRCSSEAGARESSKSLTSGLVLDETADAFRSHYGTPRNTNIAPARVCISTQSDVGVYRAIWPAVGRIGWCNFSGADGLTEGRLGRLGSCNQVKARQRNCAPRCRCKEHRAPRSRTSEVWRRNAEGHNVHLAGQVTMAMPQR